MAASYRSASGRLERQEARCEREGLDRTSLALPGPLNVNGSSVTVVGAPLVDPGLLALAVNASIVTPVSNGLTAFINNQLNTLLGIDVGGADIGALDMTCESVKLVQ